MAETIGQDKAQNVTRSYEATEPGFMFILCYIVFFTDACLLFVLDLVFQS